jgi:hypothetical protein
MTGLKDQGTAASATVNLYDNNLTAVKATNSYDGETATATTGADGGTADAGSWDDGTSGMDTMKVYLTAMAAEADADGYAGFDTVSTFDNTDASATAAVQTSLNELGPTSTPSSANDTTVLYMVEAVPDSSVSNAVLATKGKRAFAITADGTVGFTINGTAVPASLYTMTGNGAVDALNLASTANKDLASAAGLTMDAVHTYASEVTVVLNAYANNASATIDERYTLAQLTAGVTDTGSLWTVGIEDEFTLTVDTNSVTTSPGSVSGNATDLAGLEAMFLAAWAAKYGSNGTASISAVATLRDTGAAGTFVVEGLQKDSGGNGLAVSLSVTDKTQATGNLTRTSGNIGYKIGPTTAGTDNSTVATTTGGGVIVTFESKLAGVTDTVLTGVTSVVTSGKTSWTELLTSYVIADGVTTYALAQANRTDVRNVVAAVANTATGTAQTLFNRVTWLG